MWEAFPSCSLPGLLLNRNAMRSRWLSHWFHFLFGESPVSGQPIAWLSGLRPAGLSATWVSGDDKRRRSAGQNQLPPDNVTVKYWLISTVSSLLWGIGKHFKWSGTTVECNGQWGLHMTRITNKSVTFPPREKYSKPVCHKGNSTVTELYWDFQNVCQTRAIHFKV